MGLPGGSRCFNRVPRALLVIMDWSTAKHKPSGSISNRFGMKKCQESPLSGGQDVKGWSSRADGGSESGLNHWVGYIFGKSPFGTIS